MDHRLTWIGAILMSGALWGHVSGHGRLVEPPSRSSAWRYGFSTPTNYDDNQLFCGGKQVQWERNGGRCGVCGDPYQGPWHNEAGGRYATGTIVRSYRMGEDVDVKVQLTANHKGWFEFRLCPNNDVNQRVTQQCLDRYLLRLSDGSGTRLGITSSMYDVNTRLRLPEGLTCSQCVLQWKYNTGNSWGVNSSTGEACVGCGPQEQFYGCADVTITDTPVDAHSGHRTTRPTSTPNPVPRPSTHPRQRPHRVPRPSTHPRQRPHRVPQPSTHPRQRPHRTTAVTMSSCRAAGAWRGQASMTAWCQANCGRGFCPSSHCRCT